MKNWRKLLVTILLLFPALASAQTFPTKPIKLIVPFPAGGPNDIIARVIGQRMSELAGQPVLIDNRGGQGGVLGTDAVAKSAPDVPTTKEAGFPDLRIENWYGMVAPKGTPKEIVTALHDLATKAMADPAVKDKLAQQGATLVGDEPEHFRSFIADETKKWAKVIKDAGVETAQ